jgi:hypothetical protein
MALCAIPARWRNPMATNWVKCTHKGDENPIYVNIDSAMSIRWIESDKATIIAFPGGENDIVRVLERPEHILKSRDR